MKKKKRTTIIGMKVRCASCGKIFAIGKLGIEAVRKRCLDHIKEKGCMSEFVPINAPKGLTYTGKDNVVEVVYDGKDFDAFWKSVKAAAFSHYTTMSPQLELTK
jgi:hypothetical protein